MYNNILISPLINSVQTYINTLKSQKVILLLGGNQGPVMRTMSSAIATIDGQLGRLISISSVYSSKAWGPIKQDDFLNRAVLFRTTLTPGILMKRLLALEQQHGRKRDVKYGPRTLDIDMLFYGSQIIRSPALTVPHPEIENRRFALIPLAEIQADFKHPMLGKTVSELLLQCMDPLEVKLWKEK